MPRRNEPDPFSVPTTLGRFARDYWWAPWCEACGKSRTIVDFAPFIARYGADLPMEEFVKRLKCSACGSKCPTGVKGARNTGGRV